MTNTVSADDERVAGEVVSTEALRAAALAASARRGARVARRRLALRWLAWLTWQWLLPLVGLATVLAALVTLACVLLFGQTMVHDTAQAWVAKQLGYRPYVSTGQPAPSPLPSSPSQPPGAQP